MTTLPRHKAKPGQGECLANAWTTNHADSKDRHMMEGETRLHGNTDAHTSTTEQEYSLDYCFATPDLNLHLPAEEDMTVTSLLRHP